MLCEECRRAIAPPHEEMPPRLLGLIMAVVFTMMLVLGVIICWPLFN